MAVGEPARPREVQPARPTRTLTPCERELEEKNAEIARLRGELGEKNAEIAQLKEQVAKLERRLEMLRPRLGPPAASPRPFYGETPWDKRPGGPGFGP
jgi:chromosome segregation ATPase